MDTLTYTKIKTKARVAQFIALGVSVAAIGALAALITITQESEDYNILLESFKNIPKYKSVSLGMNFSINPEIREASTPELSFPGATQKFRQAYESLYARMPVDFSANLSLHSNIGSLDPKTIEQVDNHTSVNGRLQFGSAEVEVDAEAKKVKDDLYFNIHKIPFLFFGADYTAIQNQWVHLKANQLSYSNAYASVTYDVTDAKVAEYYELFETAFTTNFIKVQIPENSQTKNGLRQYKVVFDFSKYPAYVRAMDALYTKKGKNYYFSNSVLEKYEDPRNKAALDTLAQTQTMDIYIDPVKNHIRKLEYTGKFAPPSRITKFKNKQIRVTGSVSFDKINEQLTVVRPDDTISYDQALSLMTTKNLNEIQFDRQVNNIIKIRSALKAYNRYTIYGYPDSLEELLQTREDIDKKGGNKKPGASNNTNNELDYGIIIGEDDYYYDDYSNKKPFINKLVVDAYTLNAYQYTKTGDNYELRYRIHDKPVPRSYQNYSSYYYNVYPEVLEGTNTADKDNLSKEGVGRVDSDKDGLSDMEERDIYFTDPENNDTDKDSYFDGEEVKFGYNPLGPGKAGETPTEEDLERLARENQLVDDQARARDSIRINHIKQMSTILELLEANLSGSNLNGCTQSNVSAQLCRQEDGQLLFATLKDPSNPSGICNYYKNEVCEYSISSSKGYGAPKTNDYQICFFLERDTTVASAGLHSITSGGLLKSGCR